MNAYDVGIVGLGTMGSLTAMELAKRGQRVIGWDAFAPPHDSGSHSGDTRIFRVAYAEHPDYVPLAIRAGELWDGLGDRLGAKLLNRSGMLTIGASDDPFLVGIRESARLHQLKIDSLSAQEVRKNFPAFTPTAADIGLWEATAGWLDVNACLSRSLARAQDLGARIELRQRILGWKCDTEGVVVQAEEQTIRVQKLIVTAGAWSGGILKELGLPLTVKRKVLAWFLPEKLDWFQPDKLPVFAFAPNVFYGFPYFEGKGVKLAIHHGGQALPDPSAPIDPPSASDLNEIAEAAHKFLSGRLQLLTAKTCLYTMTPDEHFIVDQHPNWPNIVFAAGFSGHGFKFAPVVAEALCDLVLENRVSPHFDFLSLRNRSWRPKSG